MESRSPRWCGKQSMLPSGMGPSRHLRLIAGSVRAPPSVGSVRAGSIPSASATTSTLRRSTGRNPDRRHLGRALALPTWYSRREVLPSRSDGAVAGARRCGCPRTRLRRRCAPCTVRSLHRDGAADAGAGEAAAHRLPSHTLIDAAAGVRRGSRYAECKWSTCRVRGALATARP